MEQPCMDIPPVGSVWRHRNGNKYQVIMIANGESERLEKYPVTVVYRGENDKVWCRPLSRWHASMTLLFTRTHLMHNQDRVFNRQSLNAIVDKLDDGEVPVIIHRDPPVLGRIADLHKGDKFSRLYDNFNKEVFRVLEDPRQHDTLWSVHAEQVT